MARIRSAHPGLFTDEAFVSLSMAARLFLIGIWTEADDHGVFEWKPLSLKMRLFPADAVDVPALLAELVAADAVKYCKVEGKEYGLVRNFCKYQRPKKPTYKHVFLPEWRNYVALKMDGDEQVPHQYPTSTEEPPQMEEGVGGEEEEEVEKEDSPAMERAIAAAIAPVVEFEKFWEAYPKRDGANPREPSRKKFFAFVKSGVAPEEIIIAAQKYADETRSKKQIGTQYVAQAMTWLAQQRFRDYQPAPANPEKRAREDEIFAKHGLVWDETQRKAVPKTEVV